MFTIYSTFDNELVIIINTSLNLPSAMNWEKYGYVLASKYRTVVCISLLESQKTPTQIQKKTKIAIAHISRALNELLGKEIVECLT